MRLIWVAVMLLACAAPASAAPQLATPQLQSAALEAEMTRFGAWLIEADRVQAPIQALLGELGPRWAAVAAAQDGRAVREYRAFILRGIETVDRTRSAIQALPAPTLQLLDLPAEFQPPGLRSQLVEANGQVRTLLESYLPALDAIERRDPAAAARATDEMIRSMRLLFQLRQLMVRAQQAAVPVDQSARDAIQVQLLYLRAGERFVAAWPDRGVGRIDADLGDELRQIAAELDEVAGSGAAKSADELAFFTDALPAVEREDPTAAVVLRRALAVLEIDGDFFPLAREISALLRSQAPRFDGGRGDVDDLLESFRRLLPFRARMDDILRREGEALAGRT